MKYEKYVKDNYSLYLSTNIVSDVNIVVRFDEKEDVLNQIGDNQCIIVIKPDKIDNILKIIEEVEDFINRMKNKKISPNIVIVSNEMIDVQKFNNGMLSFEVKIDNSIKKDNETKKEIEEEEPFEKFWKVNVIKKEDNGILKSYIQRKNDSNNIGYLLDLDSLKKEDLFIMFKKMSGDSLFMNRISNMNEEEIANILLDSIAEEKNLKKYYLESNDKQVSLNDRGNIATDIASKNDGVVNKELGVIQNSLESYNQINAVEEDNGVYKVIAPEVTSDGSANSEDRLSSISVVSEQYNLPTGEKFENEKNNEVENEELQKREDLSEEKKREVSRVRKLTRIPPYENHSSGIISIFGISIIFIIIFIFILFIVM